MRILSAWLSLLLSLAGSLDLMAGDTYQKGCSDWADRCGRIFCGRRCCDEADRSASRGDTNTRAPSGPVAEDTSLLRAMPMTVSMPMMLTMRATPLESRSVRGNNDDRLDELDARIEALHLRTMTLQRAVELQTQILEELRDNGTIGGHPLGPQSAAISLPTTSSVLIEEPVDGTKTPSSLQVQEWITNLENRELNPFTENEEDELRVLLNPLLKLLKKTEKPDR